MSLVAPRTSDHQSIAQLTIYSPEKAVDDFSCSVAQISSSPNDHGVECLPVSAPCAWPDMMVVNDAVSEEVPNPPTAIEEALTTNPYEKSIARWV